VQYWTARVTRLEEMIARLSSLGFRMIDLKRFFYDVGDGAALTLEAWFDRPKA
jgi:hypothetical protein